MEIIKFPGVEKLNKKAQKKLDVEKVSQCESALLLGPITITCRNCGEKTSLSTEGLIFKHLEAYCAHCGTEMKITNPAFGLPTAQKKLSDQYKNRK